MAGLNDATRQWLADGHWHQHAANVKSDFGTAKRPGSNRQCADDFLWIHTPSFKGTKEVCQVFGIHVHPTSCMACKSSSNDANAKEHCRQTLSWSAGIAGCVKPGPATVRGTLKVFFLLFVSFFITTGGVAAVALASLLLPARFSESSSSASAVACSKHSRTTSKQ